MNQIIVAVVILVVIILVTPAKIRPFISFISLITVGIFAYYIYQTGEHDGNITIPESGDQPSYKISVLDFNKLTAVKTSQSAYVKVPNIETLAEKNKDILSYKDLSLEQLDALKNHAYYQSVLEGKMGLLIRNVDPYIENGKIQPGYRALEVLENKAVYELERKEGILHRKNKILEGINDILNSDSNKNIN
jgi:hypothetical protein